MGDTIQTVEIKDTYSKLKYTNKQTDTHTTETLYKFFLLFTDLEIMKIIHNII